MEASKRSLRQPAAIAHRQRENHTNDDEDDEVHLMFVVVVVVVLDQADRQDGFFQGRLKAFEVWLQFAGASPRVRGEGLGAGSLPDTSGAAAAAAAYGPVEREVDGGDVAQRPLEELPVVLQILLSQVKTKHVI